MSKFYSDANCHMLAHQSPTDDNTQLRGKVILRGVNPIKPFCDVHVEGTSAFHLTELNNGTLPAKSHH